MFRVDSQLPPISGSESNDQITSLVEFTDVEPLRY
jgi:hypothetical protein